MIKRKRHIPVWKKALITLSVLLVVAIGVPVGYVYHLGGLAKIVEDRIAAIVGAAEVGVGGASLAFRAKMMPVFIQARDVAIKLDDTDLVIPQADIIFGINSLVNAVPSEVSIKGLELDILRQADGWSASPLAMFLFETMRSASTTNTSSQRGTDGAPLAWAGFERLTVRAKRLSLAYEGDDSIAPLLMSNAVVSLTADPIAGIGGYLAATRVGPEGDGTISADFVGWPGTGEVAVDLTVDDLQTTGLTPYFDVLPREIDELGVISGAASIAFDGARIGQMDVAVRALGGMIVLPGAGRKAGFDNALFELSYQRTAGILSIGTAQIALADGRKFVFDGEIAQFHSPSPVIAGTLKINRISLADLNKDWPSAAAPQVKAAVFERVSGGALSDIKFVFGAGYDRENAQLSMSRMDVSARVAGVRLNLASGQYRRLVGTVDGNFDLQLGETGQVRSMRLDFTLGSGSVLLDGYEGAVGLNKVTLKAGLDEARLSLDAFDVVLANGTNLQVSGAMGFGPVWSPQTLTVSLASKQIAFNLFYALWPQWAKAEARDWVGTHIQQGLVRDAVLNFEANFVDGRPRLRAIAGSLALADAQLTLGDTIPPIANVSGKISLEDDAATIVLDQASVDDLALQYGRVTIAPLFTDIPPEATARVALKGGLATAVAVGQNFGLGKVGALDLDQIQPQGEVEMTVNAKFPVAASIKGDAVSITADATISGGSFGNLPYGMAIDNAELVANFATDLVEITGAADVAGVPSDFSFRSDAVNDNISFIAKAAPSPVMAKLIADLTRFEIGGNVGGNLTIRSDMAFADVDIQLAAEMRSASVNVPQISWAKLPAENGYVRMTFRVQNGRVNSIQDVNISLGSLSVIGQVALGQGGNVQGAFLDRIKWPGNDLRDVIIENSGDGMKIGAQARIIDLAPLRRNRGVGGGRKIDFDLVADQFVVGDGITLGGHLTGVKQKGGGGNAVFTGDLLFKGSPLIEEAELKLLFGEDGEVLQGTGLVGGGEATIDFVDHKDAPPQLTMTSKNAGRMLAGLGITDTIRAGSIEMTNTYQPGNLSVFDTEMRLRDFNVVEAPRAIRAFSVLGPMGFLQLVRGDGTRFDWGEASFSKRGSVVAIKSMRGGGSDIALSMVGRYDAASREVDVSGNLVPASLVNSVISAIPVLGNLLTGFDKDGLFVTQFTMTGSIDNPETNANAASLVPGILRDVISPKWLEREEKRILGQDQDGESTAPTVDQ